MITSSRRPAGSFGREFAIEGSVSVSTNGGAKRYAPALSALLRKGTVALMPDEWIAVQGECKSLCEQRGDARYCILHELFDRLQSWRRDHDEHGGVPTALLNNIGQLIDSRIPDVLSQTRPEVAAQLATALRDEVSSRLLSNQEWKL